MSAPHVAGLAAMILELKPDATPAEVRQILQDTAVDKGFRAVTDATPAGGGIGTVDRLLEFPVFSTHGEAQPDSIHNNNLYLAAGLADDVDADNALIPGSPLANLYHEQLAFTCGDCHLGSAGAKLGSFSYRKGGRKRQVAVFALEVERVLDRWQEDGRRLRVWVPIAEAERLVKRKETPRFVTKLRHRLLTASAPVRLAA